MPGPNASGPLRDRMRFERRAQTSDGYGNTEGDWQTLITARSVDLKPTRGGEAVIGERLQGHAAFDMWLRSDSATRQLTTDDRVVDIRDATRVFNIAFIDDMTGRKAWLLMQLTRGKADG